MTASNRKKSASHQRPRSTIESHKTEALSPASAFAALGGMGVVVRYRANSIVVTEHTPSDSVFMVESGTLRATLIAASGRELVLGDMGPGDVFGEVSLDGGRRSANVVALTDVSLRVIPAADVRALMAREPAVALALLEVSSKRLRRVTDLASRLALHDVYSRLRLFLLDLATKAAREDSPSGSGLTHAEIAQHIGCSREMVSRILSDLAAGGYIKTDKHRISLLKPLPERW